MDRKVELSTVGTIELPAWVGGVESEETSVHTTLSGLVGKIPENVVDDAVSKLAEAIASASTEAGKNQRLSNEGRIALARDLVDMAFMRMRSATPLSGHLNTAKGTRKMVRPCSGELDGQLMVYQSDIKGDVLVQLCTSEDKTGYHVRPPDGHDVVTEFKALKGLVACNAPSWTIHDIDADAKDTVVIPGDLLATSSGAVWHLLQILGSRQKALFRCQGLQQQEGVFQTFITAGKPELMAPVLFTRKVPLVSLNRKTHISPSTKSRLLQATGALADGFLRLVSSKGQPGQAVFEVPMSHRDFMEFIAPAGTVLRDSPLQDAGTSTGTDSTRPVPAIKESQLAAVFSRARVASAPPGGEEREDEAAKSSTFHVVVAPDQYAQFKALVMTPGGFVSFPERKATSAPRRGQKREFVSVIQGNIDLVLQSTTLDRSLNDSEDVPERNRKGGTCADRLVVRFRWIQDHALVA